MNVVAASDGVGAMNRREWPLASDTLNRRGNDDPTVGKLSVILIT